MSAERQHEVVRSVRGSRLGRLDQPLYGDGREQLPALAHGAHVRPQLGWQRQDGYHGGVGRGHAKSDRLILPVRASPSSRAPRASSSRSRSRSRADHSRGAPAPPASARARASSPVGSTLRSMSLGAPGETSQAYSVSPAASRASCQLGNARTSRNVPSRKPETTNPSR